MGANILDLQQLKCNNEYGVSSEFYNEEKQLLKSFIDSYFFPILNEQFPNFKINRGTIELIIRPDCNQNCEYCYITHRNGHQLYSQDLHNQPKDIILNNLKLILNYLFQNKPLYGYNFNLFAGDLFYDDLAYDIFDIFYEIFEKYCKGWSIKPKIIIPCNMSFVSNEKHRIKFKNYYAKFQQIQSEIILSASIDGKYIEKNRVEYNDEFYDIFFNFCKEINAGFHPMIAPNRIEKWIENYNWWIENLQKYKLQELPALLEVRNDEWTIDKIQYYIEFLNHMLNEQMSKHSITEMSILAFGLGDINTYNTPDIEKLIQFDQNIIKGQNPLIFPKSKDSRKISCALQTNLTIRVGDLAIVPCHRTCYNQYIAGFFETQNDQIIDIIPFNVSMYISILTLNVNTQPQCATCAINKYCIKGCLGAQFETTNDLFHPCKTVCQLFKAKFSFLLQKYYDLGIINEAIKHKAISLPMKEELNMFLERMGKDALE